LTAGWLKTEKPEPENRKTAGMLAKFLGGEYHGRNPGFFALQH
jgi:hypothetical protein